MKNIAHLPTLTQEYIEEVVFLCEKKLGQNSIDAVVLFGSLSYGTTTASSDVDLLIIVSNRISVRKIRKIQPLLHGIEIKYGLSHHPYNMRDRVLDIVEKKTGMFCSHFICRREDWDHNRFANILSLNETFVWLLAPDKIVLDSLKHGATVIYGSVPLNFSQESYSIFQILKSLFMTLLLAYGAIVILPFNRKFSKYLLEAYKWSLRASYFYLFHRTNSLTNIVSFFECMGLSNYYLKWFNYYRVKSGYHIRFFLELPFQIMKLHLLSVSLKRIIKLL